MWSSGWHTASKKQRVLRDVLDARLKDNGEGKGNKQ
jgi:hypothetical protein